MPSLESSNASGRFIRHQNFLGELTPVESDLDREDASFLWATPLAQSKPGMDPSSKLVSLRSRNFLGHFLRHQDFRIKLHEQDLTFDPNDPSFREAEKQLFREDATFLLVPGLADPNAASFQSFNRQDRFIRHRDFHLFLEPADSDQARQDATFIIRDPFVPPPPPPK